MRRRRRPYIQSFANGLLLAALPVGAFLAVDYAMTPPAEKSRAHFVAAPSETSSTVVANREAAPPVSTRVAVDESAKTADIPDRSVGRPTLIPAIQQELRRVGCLAGDADGSWNDRTKAAMQAFNASVHVNLAVDKPDFIHLTLLQGHSARACSRSCEADASRGNVCADKTIEAKAIAPSERPAVAVPRHTGEVRYSSVPAAGPATTQKAPASTIVHVAPSQAVSGSTSVRREPEFSTAAPAPVAVGAAVSRETPGAASAPLPGRMAIGALEAPPEPKSVDPALALPVPGPAAPAARPRPASAAERQAPRPASRVGRMFSDLGQSAP